MIPVHVRTHFPEKSCHVISMNHITIYLLWVYLKCERLCVCQIYTYTHFFIYLHNNTQLNGFQCNQVSLYHSLKMTILISFFLFHRTTLDLTHSYYMLFFIPEKWTVPLQLFFRLDNRENRAARQVYELNHPQWKIPVFPMLPLL